MKQKIIKALKISSIFMLGLIVGAVLMNLLHIYVRSTYRDTIRIDLKQEQEFLAGRAARNGDKLRALSHQWNVVDAEAKDGFRAFRQDRNKETDSSFLFPFYMVVLKAMVQPKEGMQEKGARISEGIERGKLALALEAVGANEESNNQWEIARTLTKYKSNEEIRRLILKLKEQENTETYLQAEKTILGEDNNKAQQKNRGDRE